MTRYLVGRILQAGLVLWGAYTVAYAILYLLPGDALAIMVTASGVDYDTLSLAQVEEARRHYGLDQGVLERYFALLGGALRGDFGFSLANGRPVTELLAERLPSTLRLAGLAALLSILGGVGYASAAARMRQPWLRSALRRLPALGVSLPVFWIGLIFIQIFAFSLGWLPSTGDEGWASLILPAVTLAIPSAAIYAQVLLRGLDQVWREPFIATARAKGLGLGQVQRRHALRNASLPLLTLLGLQVGNTVSGAVLIETVFTRMGVGRLVQEAVLRQDVPIVLAVVAISAAAFVTVNLIVDLLYPLLDPRIAHRAKPA